MSVLLGMRTKSLCCVAALLWEAISGIRVWSEVSGRRVYQAQCSKCGRTETVDGGKA